MLLNDRDKDIVFDEKFFKKLSKLVDKYLTYGVPPKDAKGHYEQITFRVDPAMMDAFYKLKGMLPEQWFKKKPELKRNLWSMAIVIAIEIIETISTEHLKTLNEVKEIVDTLNEIESILRKSDLKSRIANIKKEVYGIGDSAKVSNIISILEKMEQKVC